MFETIRHILRHISGVMSSTAVSVPLAECGLMCLPDQWLLRTATFWNALAALPPGALHKYGPVSARFCEEDGHCRSLLPVGKRIAR